eukprot:scaffold8220_cov150-Ochromonas_danica.AAC.1
MRSSDIEKGTIKLHRRLSGSPLKMIVPPGCCGDLISTVGTGISIVSFMNRYDTDIGLDRLPSKPIRYRRTPAGLQHLLGLRA